MDERNLTIENDGVEVVPMWTWSNVPLKIVKKYKELVRSDYGNSYWAGLLSIMQKAELYDTINVRLSECEGAITHLLQEIEKLKTEKKGDTPGTFR